MNTVAIIGNQLLNADSLMNARIISREFTRNDWTVISGGCKLLQNSISNAVATAYEIPLKNLKALEEYTRANKLLNQSQSKFYKIMKSDVLIVIEDEEKNELDVTYTVNIWEKKHNKKAYRINNSTLLDFLDELVETSPKHSFVEIG